MGDHIREFWESQARRHGTSSDASWGDTYALELEHKTISGHVRPGMDILDAGCANGFALLRHATATRIRSGCGVDFSAEMICQAHAAVAAAAPSCPITLIEGDIRSLPCAHESFDLVYTTRVLINLPTWEEQQRGVRECLRVCRRGGSVVLSEGFWEPMQRLNALRLLTGLAPLVEHDFNRYLKRSRLEQFLNELGLSFEACDFSSVYYLGSRFLRELLTEVDKFPGYSNPINRAFYELEQQYSGGGFGIQMAYVISKP